MQLFLSYAKEDKAVAESIAFSLRSRGHKVFLDRDDLPPGQSYDQQIEKAVKQSDIFLFLISPDSVGEGRFTLTELVFARQKWPTPHGRVLPIVVRKTSHDVIPSYLKAVTLLEPHGNITAETSAAVDALGVEGPAWDMAKRFAIAGAIGGAIAAFLPIWSASLFGLRPFGVAPDIGLVMAACLALCAYRFAGIKNPKQLAAFFAVIVPLWLVVIPFMDTIPGLSLAADSMTLSDISSAGLEEKVDAETAEKIKKSIETADQYRSLGSQLGMLIKYMMVGPLFNLVLLGGLSAILGIGLAGRDLLWASAFGVLAGVLFFTCVLMLPTNEGNVIVLLGTPGPDNISLHSWPGVIVAMVAWLALVAASVGRWLGRTVR